VAVVHPRPRLNVYFDGFNFYYGCFKSSKRTAEWRQYKWLNVSAFAQLMFPGFDVREIHYFTAVVNQSILDPTKQDRQQAYLRALRMLQSVTIHEGRYSTWAKQRLLADPISRQRGQRAIPILPEQYVDVIIDEEKGSDVNLASHLIVDAFMDRYDAAVVISNDSDLAEPIRLVRSVVGSRIIIMNPHPGKPAYDLRGLVDPNDYRSLRLGPITASQFPATLTDAHGTITKPPSW